MPYKDQTLCYRTIGGVRYVNWCDVFGEAEQRVVAAVKARGIKHRLVRHKDGFSSLFVVDTADTKIALDELHRKTG